MYYIHEFKWEPGKYTQTRLLPGYNTHAEARLVLKTFKETANTNYEIKEENLNGN